MKKIYLLLLSSVFSLKVTSQVTLYEDFTAPFNPASTGWDVQNLSSPSGTNTTGWRQGNSAQFFNAITGAPDDYFSVDKYSTSSAGATNTISCWLITPTLNLTNGAMLQFAIKTFSSSSIKPERLQVYYSFGTGNNVGNSVGTPTNSAGTFTNLIIDINPNLTSINFPVLWSAPILSLTGIPTPTVGRIGFRYYVPNGGDSGPNSNYIGLDEVRYQMPCPRPGFFGDITGGTFTVCTGISTPLKIFPNGLTPPTTYTWFNGATTSLTAYTPTLAGLNEIWSLGQNASGCQYLDISFVNVQQSPTVATTLNPGDAICAGKSVTVNASGAGTYTYALGANSFTSNPIILTANSVTNIATSQFTVVGKASNGCTATHIRSLTINPNPTITAAPSKNTVCVKAITNFTANGAPSYSWSSSSSTLNTITHTAGAVAGVEQYTVYGVSTAGCKSADVVTSVTVSLCTGIMENADNSAISVYPNPFKDKLILENFKGIVRLYNIQGQLMYEEKMEESNILETSSLATGIYMLNVTSTSGEQKNFKLIKN